MFCVSSRFISFLPHISATARHTSADLANVSAGDTIRVSASTTKLRPRYHEQHTTTPHPTTRVSSSLPVLDPLLKAYSNLDQVTRAQTRLSIPSMCCASSPPTVRIETSFQLLTMVSLPSTNKRSLRGDEWILQSQVVSTGSGLNFSDPIKEHIAEWRQPSSTTDFLSISTVFGPIDSFYHPPASPVLSKSPLPVHSFVVEPPRIYSPRLRLRSIPHRPVPFPMDPDTTPSSFLLSSESFENGMGQDPNVAGIISEDDETPTTSPTTE